MQFFNKIMIIIDQSFFIPVNLKLVYVLSAVNSYIFGECHSRPHSPFLIS